MMRAFWLISLVCLAFLATSAQGDDQRFFVRELGDPADFVFEGATTFTPDALRVGLSNDFDFILAAHPKASFEPFLTTISQRVTAGYRQGGFARAKVETKYVNGKVVVTVHEGPRFSSGKVTVDAPLDIDAAALQEWMLKPMADLAVRADAAPPKPALPPGAAPPAQELTKWVPGDKTAFTPGYVHGLTETLRQGLAQQGRFFPKFRIEITPRDDGTATLNVMVDAVGPKGTLGQIDIVGLNRNSRQELMDYLQLKEGMEFDATLRQRLTQQLDQSARFLHHDLQVLPPKEGQPVTLKITVRETKAGARLSEPLSRVEQACRKLCDWLNTWDQGTDDLMISGFDVLMPQTAEVTTVFGEVVLAPRRGVYLNVRVNDGADKPLLHQELVLQPERIRANSLLRKECWEARAAAGTSLMPTGSRLLGAINFTGLPDPKSENSLNMMFGFGVTNKKAVGPTLPIGVSVKVISAAAMVFAHEPTAKYSFDNDILTITSENQTVRIDEKTGRLIELSGSEAGSANVKIGPGLFDERVQALETQRKGFKNLHDPQNPIASLVEFVATDAVGLLHASHPDGATASRLAVKLLRQPLRQVDALVVQQAAPGQGEAFYIPPERPGAAWTEMLARYGMYAAGRVLPKENWPWIVSREFLFIFAGQGRFAAKEITGVYESHYTGPVGCLYAGSLLQFVAGRDVAKNFANRGLKKLDEKAFRRDCEELLRDETLLSRCATDLAAGLVQCTPEELNLLARLLAPAESANDVGQILQSFHTNQVDEPRVVLIQVLTELWPVLFRERVRRSLEALRDLGVVRPA